MNYKIRDYLNKKQFFSKILSHRDALHADTVFGFDTNHE